MVRIYSFVALLCVLAAVAGMAGCGGDGNSAQAPTITKLTVTPASVSLALGLTQQLSVMATYSNGTTANITSNVSWSVSPSNIATVSATGMLKTQAQGSATVTATFAAVKGQAGVTVSAAALSSIQISPGSLAVPLGTTQQLSATGKYTDGSSANLTSSATWNTSPTQTASISAGGLVRGLAKGAFTVTAAVGQVSQSNSGSVVAAVPQSLQVNPNAASIAQGANQRFTATEVFSDGSTQDVTASTTWLSSNSSVASVDSTGMATGNGQGSAQVSASYQGLMGGATLTVSAATVQSVQVSPASGSLAKGTTLQLAATATLTDGSTQNVTSSSSWSSNSTSVCTVNTAGLVTAQGVGTCKVTAVSGAANASSTLSVTAATLSGITITPTNPAVNAGGSLQLTATGTFSDGSTQNLTSSLTYVSSKPTTAIVTAAGLLQGLAPGTASVTASLGSVSSIFSVTVTAATLQSIGLSGNLTIAAGLTSKLTATGTFSDGSTQDISATVTWSSNLPGVATVDATGNVSGLGVGSASITATLGTVSSAATVSITPATVVAISINPTSVTVAAGQSQSFTASATFTDGSTLDITATAHWSVGNPLLATISNSNGTVGQLLSLAAGTTTVSASLDGVTGNANLYVTAASLVSISITPNNLSLALGVPGTLSATGTFSDGSTQDITASVQWSSSNGQIAGISAGIITPIGVGSTTLSATMSGVSGSATLNVTAAVLQSISLTVVNTLPLGLSEQLSATGHYSDGTTLDITSVVHWTSSNTGIVSIGATGLLFAVGSGSATISASLGSVGQSTTVSVSAAILQSIAVTASQNSFPLGFTLQLTATGTYSDGTTQDLTAAASWSSSDNTIAVIASNGLVSGLLPGQVSATASLQGVDGSFSVTVNSATLVSLTVSPGSVTLLNLLTTQQFTLTGHFSDGSTQTITSGAHWSVTNVLLGTIDNTGLLLAIGVGNMNAVATYDGMTASATVKIL